MAKPTRFTQQMIDGYVAAGLWDTATMADEFDHNAATIPDKEAVVDRPSAGSPSETSEFARRTGQGAHRWTWADIKRLSDRMALGLLSLGIKRDEVAVAQLPNWADNFVLWLALQKAGILGCFPATTYRQVEMEQVLRCLNAAAVVIPSTSESFDFLDMVQSIRPRLPNLRHVLTARGKGPEGMPSLQHFIQQPLEKDYPPDYLQKTRFKFWEVCAINLTSGSTGAPKLCELVQAIGKLSGRGMNQALGLTSHDVFGSFAPFSGGPGSMAYWCAPLLGMKVVMLDRFEAEDAFKAIESERVTCITTVPVLAVRMASHLDLHKYDLSSLRAIRCGGAALAPSVAQDLEAKLKARIVPGSGSMDCFAFTQSHYDDPPEVRHFTAGRPFLGNEIRVVGGEGEDVATGEAGEMWVRGACSGSGYYNDVQATESAWGELGPGGWYRTGDLVKQDEVGNVTFVGRKKDMIIRGGQNIYPKEIENILLSHPKVLDVAIVGMPDAVMGEKACAFVILKEGQEFTFAEMVAFLKDKKLANFKIPERLEIRDRFPGLVDGQKVDKKALAREAAERLKGEW